VALARPLDGGESVAIKALRAHLAGDVRARRRFSREARILGVLKGHPNVVQMVCDLNGSADSVTMLVLEALTRGDLAAWVHTRGPLPAAAACRQMDGILLALEALHAAGFVHRDVKPGNVLIAADGRPQLADFGAAHEGGSDLTASPVGTRGYAAPEQDLAPYRCDLRADVYGAGASMAKLVTGRTPGHLFYAPPRDALLIDVPASLRAWIATAVEYYPRDRFRSAGEARSALLDIAGVLPPPLDGEGSFGVPPVGPSSTFDSEER
jgi:serine/threonine-protein kinase